MPDLPLSDSGRAIVTPLTTTILREAGDLAYRRLVVRDGPHASAATLLGGITPDQLISKPIKHMDDAKAVLSGLWLWHDALDESHRLSQELVTTTGSFWHAIMHRREGDFGNSKYWYRRCANHHVLKMMGAVAGSLAADAKSDRLVAPVLSQGWDPFAFVDLVEKLHDKPTDPRHELAIKLQQAEWSGLLDYCLHAAIEADVSHLNSWDMRNNADC